MLLAMTSAPQTDQSTLAATAAQMTHGGRGILAADESIKTMSQPAGGGGYPGQCDCPPRLPRAPAHRPRPVGARSAASSSSDETFGQQLTDGRLPRRRARARHSAGDQGRHRHHAIAGQRGALITEGLDGLGARLASYAERGAAFAKWRAVFDVTHDHAVLRARQRRTRWPGMPRCARSTASSRSSSPRCCAPGTTTSRRRPATTRLALTALFDELGGGRGRPDRDRAQAELRHARPRCCPGLGGRRRSGDLRACS